MIILVLISVIFSFLMEGFATNYIPSTLPNLSIFCTVYTLISLTLVQTEFTSQKKYLIIYLICAILFDLVYTNIILVNLIIFIIIYFIIKYINYNFPNNFLNASIKGLIVVFSYNILSFLALGIVDYDTYPLVLLLKVLYSSIVMTVIYSSITYLFINKISKKLSLKKIK